VPREHVEDQHRAIDDRKRNDALEVLPLARAQIVEHEQQARVEFSGAFGDLARLAAADKRRGIDGIAPLNDTVDDARARRFGERFELGQLRFERPPRVVRVDGDDDRALRVYVARGVSRSTSQRSPSL
jgi:hypothetical protein